MAAGPPCQPFSKAAQWSQTGALGLNDHDRTSCLQGLMTLVENFLPQALLIENVPGFMKGERSALPVLAESLSDLNRRCGTRYKLSARVLNAAEFGIPQRRRRAIIIALRTGAKSVWPRVTHQDRPVRAWDALRNVRPKMTPNPGGRFARLLPSVPEGHNYQYFTERGAGPVLFGYRRRYWSFLLKLAKAEPAWTVPANPGPATGPFHWRNRPACSRRSPSPTELSDSLEVGRKLQGADPTGRQRNSPSPGRAAWPSNRGTALWLRVSRRADARDPSGFTCTPACTSASPYPPSSCGSLVNTPRTLGQGRDQAPGR